MALAWAARGNWDSALTAIDDYAARARIELEELTAKDLEQTDASPELALLDPYRIAVTGAWLGALDPALASARRAAAAEAVPRMSSPAHEAELLWLDGILAAARGDTAGIQQARRGLASGDSTWASPYERSLASFGLALAGGRREAGDSLAALSWDKWWLVSAPYFPGINRLAAARWLAAEKDPGQAARLLTWHQAWFDGDSFSNGVVVLDGVSYLEMARVEGRRDNTALAREYYQRFLQRYDDPSQGMQQLVRNAREELAMLGEPTSRNVGPSR
jgi:hypothetical protein